MNKVSVGLVALAAIGLWAAPSSAQRPQPPRQVAAAYAAGVGIDCAQTLGCVTLVPKKGESYVHLTVQDASGLPVYGTVTNRPRATPQVFGEGSEFCGETSYPTTSGKPVYVYFENHLGSWHNCPGGASRGVVRADFFRR